MIKADILSDNQIVVYNETVSDSIKYEIIAFSFPDSWRDYAKTAIFKNENIILCVVLNSENDLCIFENECYIPHEVIKAPSFKVSVFGINGDSRITSTEATVRVLQSGYAEGNTPEEPTPTEYQQIINLTTETREIAQSVRNDADSEVFKGDKGDPFKYEDFTAEQLAALKGEPFKYEDFTQEQLADLKGEAFKYEDFTAEQLAALKGEPFKYEDFTQEQLADLKGDPFTFEDFTSEQLEKIRGPMGYSGAFPQQTVEPDENGILNLNCNTRYTIPQLTRDIAGFNFIESPEYVNYEKFWEFVIEQGDTRYNIDLSNVEWYMGIAPSFSANSTTEVSLWYVGQKLCGVYI